MAIDVDFNPTAADRAGLAAEIGESLARAVFAAVGNPGEIDLEYALMLADCSDVRAAAAHL